MFVCPLFRSCVAAICPADRESLREGFWRPSEPVCARRWPRGRVPPWIAAQRRILRLGLDAGGPWNVAELAHARIEHGAVVLDPATVREASLAAVLRWLAEREPGKPTAGQREQLEVIRGRRAPRLEALLVREGAELLAAMA